MESYIIIPGIIILIAAIFVIIRVQEKKRTRAVEELAGSLGLIFSAKGDESIISSLSTFYLFSQGHSKNVSNVLKGHINDVDTTIMDYRYTTGAGKNSHTWIQTVILFQSGSLQLPAFVLRPESLFHKIGEAFGYQDIDFDSYPMFSKQYLLRGADEMAIRSIFNVDLLSYYEQYKNLSTEGNGDRLLFYRASKRVPPEEIRSFIDQGFAVFNLFKR